MILSIGRLIFSKGGREMKRLYKGSSSSSSSQGMVILKRMMENKNKKKWEGYKYHHPKS